ncbi:hypothetical protein KC19_VG142800 [Ceratodon purpureus]|uniref:Uncharacterized protein n=1 Tax=Ceratodon purpureus TaxID=3225 RepID=A0A8T0HQ37_CERPU|nr:hypothetical protein KC19_VG142800 [Ceratodon purpureus]
MSNNNVHKCIVRPVWSLFNAQQYMHPAMPSSSNPHTLRAPLVEHAQDFNPRAPASNFLSHFGSVSDNELGTNEHPNYFRNTNSEALVARCASGPSSYPSTL